jgi:hypothetical protein
MCALIDQVVDLLKSRSILSPFRQKRDELTLILLRTPTDNVSMAYKESAFRVPTAIAV